MSTQDRRPKRGGSTPEDSWLASPPGLLSQHQAPRLAPGIVWSDLLREMEEDHAKRLARGSDTVVDLPQSTPGETAHEEAA